MRGLTKDDSERIGFVTSCLFGQALDIEEMKQWVTNLLAAEQDTPLYLIDLLDFKGPLSDIFKVVGFVPHWPFGEDAELALYGIAFKRGRQPYDCPLNREEALQKLAQYPQVESAYRSEFPFIAF